MITKRQQGLLRLLVREYIDTASPVGSRAIVQKFDLPVSSATVRNDMVELEVEGYITRPHTSAGAIPTDDGYRYYVETTADTSDISVDFQRTIRHQFHQVELELDQWARLAATVMAQSVHTVALVTLPRHKESKWHRVEVIPFDDTVVMVICVMHEGQVRQQMISLHESSDRKRVDDIASHLNETFQGLTRSEVLKKGSTELDAVSVQILDIALEMMRAADIADLERPYIYGLSEMLKQPEFTLTDQVREIVETLEDVKFLPTLIGDHSFPQDIRILIGTENPFDGMHDCALILTEYGVASGAVGALGILGPRRMDYRQAIPIIRYVSDLLTELSTDVASRKNH